MEIVTRATIHFPCAPETKDNFDSTVRPNQDGYFPIWDAKENEVCLCRSYERAEAVAAYLNAAAQGSESLTLEMRF